MSFQSISDLNGAIAYLDLCGQTFSCEFFEIKMGKFCKSMKHKGQSQIPAQNRLPDRDSLQNCRVAHTNCRLGENHWKSFIKRLIIHPWH